VVGVVNQHEKEPGGFDYKEVLNASRDEKGKYAESIRHTVCSMANADGGYILFGVKERKAGEVFDSPIDRIVGIPAGDDLHKHLGEKLKKIERRPVDHAGHLVRIPNKPALCVYVVSVPRSNLRPHIDTSDGRFLARDLGGFAAPMGFMQVRDMMLYTEGRMQRVTLLRIELAAIAADCSLLSQGAAYWHIRLNTGGYMALLADLSDMFRSDKGLLKFLFSVGRSADVFNSLLDRANQMRAWQPTNGPESQLKAEIMQSELNSRATLQNQCNEALERLTKLFGPIDDL
jgi:hypothetical protein